MPDKVVFRVGDSFVDPNGKPVNKDGSPIVPEGIGPVPQPTPDPAALESAQVQVKALSAELETTKADLHAATQDREAVQSQLATLDKLHGEVVAQYDALNNQQVALNGDLKAAQARVRELEASTPLSPVLSEADSQQVRADSQGSQTTPLPDDFPMRALLVENGFDTLEKVRAGIVKPDGAEKSPVENISGIGPATTKAIQERLA